ncbi:hypothetical protein MG5_04230 [Candida albicans P57072]|nr:hypothetical protein MG5_04230 [Candida albicans P57072]
MSNQQGTQTQDTDYSSDFDEFAATFNNFKPKEFKSTTETSTLISSAARLELESITLKQTMSDTIKSFSKLPVKKLTETHSQVKQLYKDISDLKQTINETNQIVKEELLEIKNSFLNNQEQFNLQIQDLVSNQSMVLEKGFSEQTNYVSEIIGKERQLFETSQQQCQYNLQEKINQQSIEYNKLTTQIEGQNKDIQEIKQFLKLLVPRIVGIEASYKVLSTENPIMESQQKPRPIKRKKQS